MATVKTPKYSIPTVCRNCRNYDEFHIPFGKRVSQVLPSVVCLKCGCTEVKHRKIEGLNWHTQL